ALCNAAIAGCRPGTTGQEIFRRGLDHLEPQRAWLEDEGFCPRSDRRLTEIFGRDIGHLLGKQEPATCVFDSACAETLEAGMVAAAEIQWPYRRYCVGVEDNFLITDDGPVNLTRATS
ncbi:MAG: M24 family metallopeptidase, partial [Acidimicrobiales bacterium]